MLVIKLRNTCGSCIIMLFLLISISSNAQNTGNAVTPILTLPYPTGNFDVGSLQYKFAANSNEKPTGHMLFQIWYPAALNNYEPDYYLSTALFDAMDKTNYQQIDSLSFKHWKHISNHSTPGAPIFPKKEFPIIFFLPSQGMSQFNYTAMIEDIVSRGFVVVSIDMPAMHFMAFATEKELTSLNKQDLKPHQIHKVIEDVGLVYDWIQNSILQELIKLKRSIDFNKAGIMGHKSGGSIAMEIGKTDHRFTACINLGGNPGEVVSAGGLRMPSLIFVEENSMNVSNKTNAWKEILKIDASVPAFILSIDHANTYTYTDFPFLTDTFFNDKTNADEVGKRHERLLTINAYVQSFFEQYLGIQPAFKIRKLLKEHDESTLLASTERF